MRPENALEPDYERKITCGTGAGPTMRASDAAWRPSRLVLLAGGAQIVYFVVPIVQAYGGETFEELVFGSVELAALICTGVVTIQYLAVRDNSLPGAPALVSLWSGVWSRLAGMARFWLS